MGIIEKNDSYCNNELSRLGMFPKSYRFALPYSNNLKVIELPGENVMPRLYDYTMKSDPVCAALATNCCRLTLDHAALALEHFEIRSEALTLMAHLQAGSASVKRGRKVQRIYHRLNRASKRVRNLLRLNGEPLIEYDMKSAHPVLALSLYADQNWPEALAYRELLKKDVYSVYGVSREDAKRLLRTFFYSKKHALLKSGLSKNPVANYFRVHFPLLFAAIVASTDLASRLQNLESYFFNDFIVPKAQELRLFYISIHDGFICNGHEATKTIRYLIQQEFFRLFCWTPEILRKEQPIERIA